MYIRGIRRNVFLPSAHSLGPIYDISVNSFTKFLILEYYTESDEVPLAKDETDA